MPALSWILAAVALTAAFDIGLVYLFRYRRFRGDRLVVCPENQQPVRVELDAGRAALASMAGKALLTLKNCSRWPEKATCGQECLAALATAPDGCLVSSLVRRWYEGKSCTLCDKEFREIAWLTHRPGVVDAAGRTYDWSEIPVEKVPETMVTHLPVCWDCHILETVRRLHPDLIVERPPKEQYSSLYRH